MVEINFFNYVKFIGPNYWVMPLNYILAIIRSKKVSNISWVLELLAFGVFEGLKYCGSISIHLNWKVVFQVTLQSMFHYSYRF